MAPRHRLRPGEFGDIRRGIHNDVAPLELIEARHSESMSRGGCQFLEEIVLHTEELSPIAIKAKGAMGRGAIKSL